MILQGDALTLLRDLPDEHVQCVVTSPPYWGLRDYGVAGQLGLEPTPEAYVARMVEVFAEVRRVLRKDGTLWLNLGDSYHSGDRGGYRNDAHRWEKSELQRANRGNAETIRPNRLPQEGLKDKDLVGIPWRVAFALQADGWWLRSDIIWHKPNPMPESVTDRPTKAHEYLFLLTKSERYYFDQEAVREPHKPESVERAALPWNGNNARGYPGQPQLRDREEAMDTCHPNGRNIRTVWTIATQPYAEAHFATFPEDLVEPCIKAGTKRGVQVLDPFAGSGTVGAVCKRLDRRFLGLELNPAYIELAERRIASAPCYQEVLDFWGAA